VWREQLENTFHTKIKKHFNFLNPHAKLYTTTYRYKNNDIWIKDDSREKAFTQMESKQIQQLKEWEKDKKIPIG